MDRLVRDHVREEAEAGGAFIVEDDVLGRVREATLRGVHADKVARLEDGRVFVCADFTGEDGEVARPLDLDFYMSSDGVDWFVDEVQIHKVAGKPRFVYDKKNRRVPVKKTKR